MRMENVGRLGPQVVPPDNPFRKVPTYRSFQTAEVGRDDRTTSPLRSLPRDSIPLQQSGLQQPSGRATCFLGLSPQTRRRFCRFLPQRLRVRLATTETTRKPPLAASRASCATQMQLQATKRVSAPVPAFVAMVRVAVRIGNRQPACRPAQSDRRCWTGTCAHLGSQKFSALGVMGSKCKADAQKQVVDPTTPQGKRWMAIPRRPSTTGCPVRPSTTQAISDARCQKSLACQGVHDEFSPPSHPTSCRSRRCQRHVGRGPRPHVRVQRRSFPSRPAATASSDCQGFCPLRRAREVARGEARLSGLGYVQAAVESRTQ